MIVGIDLGTSNCAVALADPAHGRDARVHDFPIPQLQRLGEVAPRPLLPSFIYLPAPHEFPAEAIRLPWDTPPGLIVGEFARWQGARVPGRMVASAKSWLCHPAVDRAAPILPWGAPPDVPKISPVAASAAYLRHVVQAWNTAHPEAPLLAQDVVITVPASFDEAARALTVTAAREAGFEKFTLLEEPEAAFYDFTARHRHQLGTVLESIRLVLVVDVGGGTTDFTLVQVSQSEEGPRLQRIAVGDHLMLGGDNMDAALARRAEEQMGGGSRKLSAVQWSQLVQSAREAKERLLGDAPPETVHLSIAGEGSRLLGGTLSARLTAAEVEHLVVDGFLPRCGPEASAKRAARAALQELGLPYAQDAAITRHLADFLRKHAESAFAALGVERAEALPRPDAILLNGGVFNSAKLADRLVDVVSSWWPNEVRLALLPHRSLDLAVARGAAYFGLVRHGLGLRISGGAAHALYVGLGSSDPAAPPRALCVIPRGHEQGETVELREQPFQLALGKPVQFPLYSTTSDRRDRAGTIVPVTEELEALPPIHTLLKGRSTGAVPIHLRATLTEIGTLELSCVSTATHEQWRLEFELRGTGGDATLVTTESMPPHFSDAKQAVEFIFSARPKPPKPGSPAALPKDVKQLWASLERALGPRAQWTVPVVRELWTALLAGAPRRRRSSDHERIFFQLLGYCLRPGFGYPLDEWRCGETFRLFGELVEFHKDKPNWTEFWILWRRIAPGLDEAQQRPIWEYLEPFLALRLAAPGHKNVARPKGIQPEGVDEMIRTAASLEQLSPEEKTRLAEWILPRLVDASAGGGPWAWAVGRLGARVPVRGSSHKVVPPEIASRWIEQLLALDWRKVDGAAFAAAQLARLSGDRMRDIDDALRARVVNALRAIDASPSWLRFVTEIVGLEKSDAARVLGDTLPAGLQLLPMERP